MQDEASREVVRDAVNDGGLRPAEIGVLRDNWANDVYDCFKQTILERFPAKRDRQMRDDLILLFSILHKKIGITNIERNDVQKFMRQVYSAIDDWVEMRGNKFNLKRDKFYFTLLETEARAMLFGSVNGFERKQQNTEVRDINMSRSASKKRRLFGFLGGS